MKQAILSVCVITYNQAKFIKQALDSILAQEISVPWQLIIADDYSTDGTREILQEYKTNHADKIELILQKKNVGPEANWLDLISYPKSKYVAYMEGDDYLSDPNKLQLQVDFLNSHPDFSLCFHPVKVIHNNSTKTDQIFPAKEQIDGKSILEIKDLLMNNFIQTNSVVYRWQFTNKNVKDIFPKAIIPGDWFLHLLHARAGKIGYIDKVMAVYRKHSASLWSDADSNIDRLWSKYAIPHLNLYAEMMKAFGDNDDNRKIIEGSMINAFRSIAKANESINHKLLEEVIAKFPQEAEVFIKDLVKQSDGLVQHMQGQAKMIDDYQHRIKFLEQENSVLQARPLMKLDRSIKKHIRRNG